MIALLHLLSVSAPLAVNSTGSPTFAPKGGLMYSSNALIATDSSGFKQAFVSGGIGVDAFEPIFHKGLDKLDVVEKEASYDIVDAQTALLGSGLVLAPDGKTLFALCGLDKFLIGSHKFKFVFKSTVQMFKNVVDTSGGAPSATPTGELDVPKRDGERAYHGAVPTSAVPHLAGGALLVGGRGFDSTGDMHLKQTAMWVNLSTWYMERDRKWSSPSTRRHRCRTPSREPPCTRSARACTWWAARRTQTSAASRRRATSSTWRSST
jgi:hypothetical protein